MLSPRENSEFKKRAPGNIKNYVKNGSGWRCRHCGADIIGAQIDRPVGTRGFASGGGECTYDTVLYCPNCEKKPNF